MIFVAFLPKLYISLQRLFAKTKMEDPPSVNKFVELLSADHRWYDLGIFLGVDPEDLTTIQHSYSLHGTRRCLIEIHTLLKKENELKSWNQVIEALKLMRNFKLAEIVSNKAGIPYVAPQIPEVNPRKRKRSHSFDDESPDLKRRKLMDLYAKVNKWKTLRRQTIGKLKEHAAKGDGTNPLWKGFRYVGKGVCDGLESMNMISSGTRGYIRDSANYTEARYFTPMEEHNKICKGICHGEIEAYKNMMEEFKKFGEKCVKELGLSEMDDPELPVSFGSLKCPVLENIEENIERLKEEVVLVNKVLESLYDQ